MVAPLEWIRRKKWLIGAMTGRSFLRAVTVFVSGAILLQLLIRNVKGRLALVRLYIVVPDVEWSLFIRTTIRLHVFRAWIQVWIFRTAVIPTAFAIEAPFAALTDRQATAIQRSKEEGCRFSAGHRETDPVGTDFRRDRDTGQAIA